MASSMSNGATNATRQRTSAASYSEEQLVTFKVDGQTFGIPALRVRDVLRFQPLTRVPLAPPQIAGTINLRGHIVTAINVRVRLGSSPASGDKQGMCVVVESRGESYCLIVDSVGDVISIKDTDIEPNPGSLSQEWAVVSRGIYRSDEGLTLLLDVDQMLTW